MSKLVKWVGIRTIMAGGKTVETHLHVSSGKVKDGKFLPVIPVKVPQSFAMVWADLGKEVTRLDAIRAMQALPEFAAHKEWLKSKETAEIADEAKAIEEAKSLLAAVDARKAANTNKTEPAKKSA